ncbi:hypothetical protein MACJ_002426 [Theileria orientalis]|uniref:Uncharacterized protein n=1 Tax=Theileria orientalis TaxID=68886 RepID=A0A976M5Z8_THEOR|nr:hypothetical protein MACJ_002426 [Theileria orientalis]
MGGGYSYLYIDLDGHGDRFAVNHYNINVRRFSYLTHFERETHSIKFLGDYATYSWLNRERYYVYLRFAQGKEPFFTYYVSQASHILKEVDIYYSKNPRLPLIIGFVRSDGTQYYTVFYLTRIKSYYGFPPDYFFYNDVRSKIIQENNICNKIKLIMEPHKYQNYRLQTSRTSNDFKTYSYTPKPKNINESYAVTKEVIFWLDRNIDYGFLYPFNLKYFDSITVYYSNANTALFVQLVDYNNKICFARNDKNGYWWRQLSGVDDRNLESKIKDALSQFQKNTKLLFILDRKFGYHHVNVYADDFSTNYYTIYNHSPSEQISHSNPILLLNGDEIKLVKGETISKVDGITTYFLKNMDGLEDTTPFLIVAHEFVNGSAQFTYYSKTKEDEKEWTNLTVIDEIDELLKQISSILHISHRFSVLRSQAFNKLKDLKPHATIQPDAKSIRKAIPITIPPPGVILKSPDSRGGFSSSRPTEQKQHPLARPRPAPVPISQPGMESPPEPPPVERQELLDKSQYEKAHSRDEVSTRTASPIHPPGNLSPSSFTSTHSRESESSHSRLSGTTSVTQGHPSSRSPDSPGQGTKVKVQHPPPIPSTPQRSNVGLQDRGEDPLPPPAILPGPEGGTKVANLPKTKPDGMGEMETRSQTRPTQQEGGSGERHYQTAHSSFESRTSNHTSSDSSSHLKPQSESHTGDNQKQDDESDDIISTTVKIAGGVAGTAIGAGAIGGASYYISGVLSIIQWLI